MTREELLAQVAATRAASVAHYDALRARTRAQAAFLRQLDTSDPSDPTSVTAITADATATLASLEVTVSA